MSADHVRTSRFLSLILRHKPEKVGLTLDPQGWVKIDALLVALAKHGRPLTRPMLGRVVAENDKKRFAISADGRRIRAVQGHSRTIDLGLSPVPPPPQLYHGTVERFLDAIRREGLRPHARQYVHLSEDEATAAAVGARRGTAVVLVIQAGSMWTEGHAFLRSENGVWLCAAVPARHITFP